MSGRGRNGGHGGFGYTGYGRVFGNVIGHNYSVANSASKKGLCSDLGNNIFNYGQKAAANYMRTSWEKFVKYVSTKYGQDIRNELKKKIKSNIFSQVHSNKVLVRQATQEALVRTGQSNIQAASRAQVSVLRAAAIADP